MGVRRCTGDLNQLERPPAHTYTHNHLITNVFQKWSIYQRLHLQVSGGILILFLFLPEGIASLFPPPQKALIHFFNSPVTQSSSSGYMSAASSSTDPGSKSDLDTTQSERISPTSQPFTKISCGEGKERHDSHSAAEEQLI